MEAEAGSILTAIVRYVPIAEMPEKTWTPLSGFGISVEPAVTAYSVPGLKIETWGTQRDLRLPSPVPKSEGPGAPSS